MKVSRYNNYKYNNYLLQIILFLTFLGFYAVLLMMFNMGKSEMSRSLTIPMRMLIGLSCGLLFINNFKNRSPYLIWFIAWVCLYFLRIVIDYNKQEYFYMPYGDLIFYLLSFVVIPFIGLSKVNYKKIDFDRLYKVVLLSAMAFSALAILLYGKYIGQVGRLSSGVTNESVISPLILSYCGSLVIGITSFHLLYVKSAKKIRYLSLITLGLAVIPFFLGASRGSLFALFFPFVLMAFSNLTPKSIIKYILLFIVLIMGLVYLDQYLESGLLSRFMGTSQAIEEGSSSAIRLDIWKKSLNQFTTYPVFGDKLNTQGVNGYPHNIFIEVLQTTGIIGFIPFIILFFKGIGASLNIFKYHKKYAWVTVFFIQTIMHNMFSGAVYTAAWFWTSLAIVISLNYSLKKNEL
ncbi:O-antigen ligase family protein [Empedobacter falsenii]